MRRENPGGGGMRGLMMDFPLTLVPILERAGKYFGKIEIVWRRPDRSLARYTYGDFYRRARRLAAGLTRAGLARGDRVATLAWNHQAHLESYLGVPVAGGVLHPLNLRLHPDELAYIVNHAGDRFLIVDDLLLPLYESIRAQTRFERVWVVPYAGSPARPGAGTEVGESPARPAGGYEELLAGAPETFAYPDLDENEAAAMCYTSGTTGRSKGVLYSHRAIVLHTFGQALAETFALAQRDVVLPVVPMFHANGWGIPFAATMVGAKVVLPGCHADPEGLLDLIERERVTVAGGVPTVWIGVLDALEKNPGRWKLPGEVRLWVGGTAPPEALIRALDRRGFHILHSWGMTETTPMCTMNRLRSYMEDWPEDERYKMRAKQGYPAPFIELRVMRGDREAPWDGTSSGELEVRGAWVAADYWNAPEHGNRWTADGWFRTGDVATIDPEGYVKILDRAKDLIKSGGEWISSVDLESALMAHPAVREAAVIGVPHPKWQERPLAIVALKDGAAAAPEELRDFLAASFAKWQLPDGFVFVSEIPRTSVGKFAKIKLREQYRAWKPE
jgi:acyl-CoA synthetase (AMP-forming)/AMP-acid ligase II